MKEFIRFVSFVSVLAMIFTETSCSVQDEVGPATGTEDQEQNVTAVKTECLSRSTLWKFIELNGDIRAEKSLKVYPVMAGKITGSAVHLGSKVKKGSVVAYVDPSTPGAYYSLHDVTSPISGTVISIPLKDGTRVGTDTAIVSIGDLSKLQIITYIPERYVSYLRTGLKADVMLEACPDEVFAAEVQEISPVVDEATRTKEVILSFTVPDGRINAGMYANIKLYLKEYTNVLSVPNGCIVQKNGRAYVYTISEAGTQDGKPAQASVLRIAVGDELDDRTIITPEQQADAQLRVIVQGYETLQEGSLVNDVREQ